VELFGMIGTTNYFGRLSSCRQIAAKRAEKPRMPFSSGVTILDRFFMSFWREQTIFVFSP
jgi:hypothetical protein